MSAVDVDPDKPRAATRGNRPIFREKFDVWFRSKTVAAQNDDPGFAAEPDATCSIQKDSRDCS